MLLTCWPRLPVGDLDILLLFKEITLYLTKFMRAATRVCLTHLCRTGNSQGVWVSRSSSFLIHLLSVCLETAHISLMVFWKKKLEHWINSEIVWLHTNDYAIESLLKILEHIPVKCLFSACSGRETSLLLCTSLCSNCSYDSKAPQFGVII